MHPRLSVTNIFLLISFFFSLITLVYPELYIFWINDAYLMEHNYLYVALQFLFYGFIHNSLLWIVVNFLFVYYFWNEVETMLGDKKFLLFYVVWTIIIWLSLLLWGTGNTVWMNGISTGFIAYYTYELYKRGNPSYRSGLTALAVNIVLWVVPWISMLAIITGGIYGWIVFQINKKLLK